MLIPTNETVERPIWIIIYYFLMARILQCAEQQMALWVLPSQLRSLSPKSVFQVMMLMSIIFLAENPEDQIFTFPETRIKHWSGREPARQIKLFILYQRKIQPDSAKVFRSLLLASIKNFSSTCKTLYNLRLLTV